MIKAKFMMINNIIIIDNYCVSDGFEKRDAGLSLTREWVVTCY